MPKTIKNSFDNKLTFIKLIEAHKRARKGKRSNPEVIKFEIDLETNIATMLLQLQRGTYHFGKYRTFYIYEPKERMIRALPYRDRIVHQWFVEEFIKPFFYPRFIKDTYACIDGRGTHMAVKVLQTYMRHMQKKYGNYYVLKCDIKKFFYNIDKKVLVKILTKRISDKKILKFIDVILDDGEDVGIPIGNYTSQYFANIYLNELDHYVKEVLQIKYYIRYMDDFVFLLKDKETAKIILEKVNNFVNSKLNLELNQKTKYFPSSRGINFCGFIVYPTHILLRRRFKDNVKEKIKIWTYLYENDLDNPRKIKLSWNSIKGHAKHADAYKFMEKMQERKTNAMLIGSKKRYLKELEEKMDENEERISELREELKILEYAQRKNYIGKNNCCSLLENEEDFW